VTGLIGSSKQAAPVGISPQILRSSLTCHAVALLEGGTFRCQLLYLGCSRGARPLPRGCTGHVAHPIHSIQHFRVSVFF